MVSLQQQVGGKIRRLRQIVGDPDRKAARLVAQEVGALLLRGQSPMFYVERALYRRGTGDPRGYVTDSEAEQLYALKRRGDGWLRSFNDKVLFDQLFRPSGLPLPAFLGHTRMGSLVRPDGTGCPLGSRGRLTEVVAGMVGASPSGGVFAKPVVANKGTGALRVTAATLEQKAGSLYEAVSRDDYLFQEAVRQHDGMAALYPHSLNTLRVLTGQDAGGGARVLCAVGRMGSGGATVDNSHAGGLFIGVDLGTGRLMPYAHRLYGYGGDRFGRHPDTGVQFEGYPVPFFDEAMEVARRAHDWLPHPYAGWDVGITPDGPVVIEGNAGPHLLSLDVAYGGLKTTPAFRDFLDSHRIDYAGPETNSPVAGHD